jgi:hypothetical protein
MHGQQNVKKKETVVSPMYSVYWQHH